MKRLTNEIYTFQGRVEDVENDYIKEVQRKLKEYEDLEEKKKLLKLLCAVGDTVYAFLPHDNHLTVAQINKIEIKPTIYGKMCYFIEPVAHRGRLYRYYENDFGKTVFLTEEQAGAVLQQLNETEG